MHSLQWILCSLLFCTNIAADTLSLVQCVTYAISNNPQAQAAAGTALSGKGQFLSARSSLLPQLNAQVQASRAGGFEDGAFQKNGTASGVGTSNSNSIGIALQQQVFGFGKSFARANAGRAQWNASVADSMYVLQQVVFTAMSAYFALAQNSAVESVSTDAYRQAVAHLRQAKALYDAGKGIRYAVVRAQMDTANARLAIIKSHNATVISHLQLENVIGVTLPDNIMLVDTGYAFHIPNNPDSVLQTALDHRTDFRAAHLRAEAARAQVMVAQRAIFPSISIGAGAGYRTPDPALGWDNYVSGNVTVAVPLFTGGALLGSVKQAQGAYQIALAAERSSRQAITLDVQQQLASVAEARQRMTVAVEAIEQATQALALVSERFVSGVGTALEVSDAETALAHARITQIQARYDFALANVRLSRAIGIYIIGI